MGLFSKKPKPAETASPAAAPAAAPAPAPARPGPAPKADKPSKADKPPKPAPARVPRKIDPADFVALRSELADVRARLEASEQAKSIVEARLAALDATTTAIASNRLGGDDLRTRLNDLEGQLHGVSAAAAAAASAAENATNKANTATAMAAAPHPTTDPILSARVEALVARVDAIPSTPAEPATPTPTPVDPQLLERLEAIAGKVQLVDELGVRLAELQERITAQTDTVQAAQAAAAEAATAAGAASAAATAASEASAATAATAAASAPAVADPSITDAPAVTDSLAAQIAQLAERIAANDTTTRQAVEQVNTLEQRLSAVSTELANQVSELGNDIDGLAAHQNDVATGTISDEVIDALKSAQVKLAAEQARYEITFRQDLAALAEQIRRAPKG